MWLKGTVKEGSTKNNQDMAIGVQIQSILPKDQISDLEP